MNSCSMKFHDLVTFALNMCLLVFVSTSFQFVLLFPVAAPSHFVPHILLFPSFMILLNIPCVRCCLHFLHTVSESIFNKYKVQLTSVSISWCSPGIEFSLRFLKPCASDNKAIYFTVIEFLSLWHFLPSTYGPKMFRYMIYFLPEIGLTPCGSSKLHIYKQTIHRKTKSTQTIRWTTQLNNWEECGPCPVFESYTMSFSLQLRISTEKPQSGKPKNASWHDEIRICRTEHT